MEHKLERKYGLFTAICLVVGIVIGSGVFFKAQTILHKTEGNMPLGIIAWVIGGLIILYVEHRHEKLGIEPRVKEMDDMDWKDALKVGVAQCLAMIPGTSRSGATIIGGLIFGLSRKAATEFSFFLAIPTIFGATVWDLWQAREQLVAANLPGLAVGTVVSFFSALVVVHWLIRFVSRHDFRGFGWYRIIFGGVILLTWATGLVSW